MWNTILFDLDGTLTDSGEGITRCVQYALKREFNREVSSLHDLDSFVGPPLKEQFMSYAGLSPEEADRAVEAYRERYTRAGMYENRLYDGIRELLDTLVRHNFTLAVASSKPERYCRQILQYFGIDGYFRTIVGSRMDGTLTDKREVVEEALMRLGKSWQRGEAVLVGDRNYDVEGARAAGISSIGVTYGYGSREELESAWPDCIVDDTVQLRNVLLWQAFEYGGRIPSAVGAEKKQNPDGPVLFRIWRILYPLLIDYGISLGVSLAGLIIIALLRTGNVMETYYHSAVLLTGIADAVLIPVSWYFFKGDERKRKDRNQGSRLLNRKKITPAALFRIAVFALAVSGILNQLIGSLHIESDAYNAVEETLGAATPTMLIAIVACVGPAAEEFLFRAVIYRRLRDYIGFGWAAVISGVLFGAAHGNLVQGLFAGIFGIVLALIYEHYGTVWASVIAHFANNLFAVVVDAIPGSNLIAYVAYLLVCLVLTAALGYRIFRKDPKVNCI